MKTCALCGTRSDVEHLTCSACGEGSWLPADPEPEPAHETKEAPPAKQEQEKAPRKGNR